MVITTISLGRLFAKPLNTKIEYETKEGSFGTYFLEILKCYQKIIETDSLDACFVGLVSSESTK